MPTDVLRLENFARPALARLLKRYQLKLEVCAADSTIPGSFWGDDEAGLFRNRLYARSDTPLHSILHETCHYICMEPSRRLTLDSDAGSDESEENAVCYLQILLADELPGFGRERMLADMDAWGYSFRLGNSRAWFEKDAEDALNWLRARSLIDCNQRPTWQLRS